MIYEKVTKVKQDGRQHLATTTNKSNDLRLQAYNVEEIHMFVSVTHFSN